MKKALLSVAAVAALAATAAPAAAQSYYGYGRPDVRAIEQINVRQAQLDRRIEQGMRNGRISQREAWNLRGELRTIDRLERQYGYNGLSQREYVDLSRRLDRLTQLIRYERRDREYGYGYGRGW